MKYIILSLIMILSSCQSDKLPEDVLRSYVNYRFSKKQTKSDILKRTTGTINGYIQNMSEVDFNRFSQEMVNFQRKKFKINLKKCTDVRCFITYTLIYGHQGFELDEVPEGSENNQQLVGKVENTYESGATESLSLVRSGKRTKNGIEVKKIAELSLVDGEWKISQVNNIRTYIEGESEVMIEASDK